MDPRSPIARGSWPALSVNLLYFTDFCANKPHSPPRPLLNALNATHGNFYAPRALDCGSAHLKYSRTRGLLSRSLYRRHISTRLTLTNSLLKASSSLPLRNIKSPQTHFNPV